MTIIWVLSVVPVLTGRNDALPDLMTNTPCRLSGTLGLAAMVTDLSGLSLSGVLVELKP